MSRQSTYTEELAETICERITDGESLRAICEHDDMPDRKTVLRWLNGHPTFAAKYAHAREAQADYMDDKILTVADKITPETAAADRVRIDAYKWRASKLAPKRYGDKQILDHTSSDGTMATMSETEQAARIAAILAAAQKAKADSE